MGNDGPKFAVVCRKFLSVLLYIRSVVGVFEEAMANLNHVVKPRKIVNLCEPRHYFGTLTLIVPLGEGIRHLG